LIKFCEQRQLTDLAAGLREDLVSAKSAATSKDLQDRTLQIIRKAVKADEAKKVRDEATGMGIKRGSA
jgi:phosphoenolpyruvate synthase/pyruvate phosphate dikinase